jgi:hypothetical protein
MTFILRWPAILALFALVLVSLVAAAAATVVLAHLPVDLSAALTADQLRTLGQISWIETGLWYGAGLFFLISAIRLIRRTQGFWMWLLGFACYGGRWAFQQQNDGGLVATVQQVHVQAFAQPQALAQTPEAPEAQLGVLAIVLIVGLIIFIVDAADRAYWDRQGA